MPHGLSDMKDAFTLPFLTLSLFKDNAAALRLRWRPQMDTTPRSTELFPRSHTTPTPIRAACIFFTPKTFGHTNSQHDRANTHMAWQVTLVPSRHHMRATLCMYIGPAQAHRGHVFMLIAALDAGTRHSDYGGGGGGLS